jgi:hypothetical protein
LATCKGAERALRCLLPSSQIDTRPNLAANVKEILRVLKPGGTFALIAEAYRGGPLCLIYGIIMPLIRAAFLSDAEHRDLLVQAGFTEVVTKHAPGKNWICATGRKP